MLDTPGVTDATPADSSDDAEAQNLLADAVAADAEAPDTGADDAAQRLAALEKERDKWKTLARRHEDRAKANADAASKAKTVEEQLGELRKAMADRDVADVQRAGKLAVSQVHARLAEAGLSRQDVAGLLDLVDPTSLLADGEPDDAAIDKLAKSLTKIAGRATPDRDQGRKGGDAPPDMNTLIRRAAGIPI